MLDIRFIYFAKLACPILEVPVWSYQLNRPFTECNDWQKLVLPKISALNPDVLITTDQFKPAVTNGTKSDFDTPFLWTDQYPKALAHLKQMAKKVIVISNNPSMTDRFGELCITPRCESPRLHI
jgi:hypothetical protein